jgi:hypothetical protein
VKSKSRNSFLPGQVPERVPALARQLSPRFRCQPVKLFHILLIDIGVALFSQRGKKLLGQHQTNRMDGFVPVESFFHQSQKNGPSRKRVPERHLVLDDHVGSGVQSLVGKPDSILAMVLPDRFNALGFIELLPSLRVNVLVRVVLQDCRLRSNSKPSFALIHPEYADRQERPQLTLVQTYQCHCWVWGHHAPSAGRMIPKVARPRRHSLQISFDVARIPDCLAGRTHLTARAFWGQW